MVKRIKIHDLDVEYETDYRNVKYPRLEFKTGRLLLVLPKNYREETKLLEKHRDWIYKKGLMIKLAKKEAKKKKIEARSEEELKDFIYALIREFSKDLGVELNKIYFRELRSKWGSCSVKKNLTFNTLLRYLPEDLIRYVVFHEVVHLKEKKHNERFWKYIREKFGDYQKKEKDLLVYWFLVQDILSSKKETEKNE